MFCKSRKWVCILTPLVQMNREVNIKKYKFFKNYISFSVKRGYNTLTYNNEHWR